MTIDAYSYPPCGTNQKIKFYCPDMIGDIEKIERMLQGEQRVACLEYVQKLLQKHPEHSVPLFYNAILQLQLSEEQQATEAVKTFLEKHPDNPAAHALYSTLQAALGNVEEAVDELQTALENTVDQLHPSLYDAFGAVGQGLLMRGHVLGARSHFSLQANIAPEDDNSSMQMLVRLNQTPEIPIFLKQDLTLTPCPEGFPRISEFDSALQDAAKGRWRRGLDKFEELRKIAPRNSAILENIASLQYSLGLDEDAVATLHSFAKSVERSEFETAVEAEALAKSLVKGEEDEKLEVAQISFEIREMEQLLEKLRVDERCEHLPVDLSQLGTEDTPPPRAAYLLLDRPRVAAASELTLDTVSSVLSEILVYGKETDRESRVEFSAAKGNNFQKTIDTIKEVCGDTIGSDSHEEPRGEIFAQQVLMNWQWRLPDDITPELKSKLMGEKRRTVILDEWTSFPQKSLDGKSPLEAADDGNLRLKLAAEVLSLEMVAQQEKWLFDFADLREKLKLPQQDEISPENLDIVTLPLTRLHRLPADKLSDEDLVQAYGRSVIRGLTGAVSKLANELLTRDSLKDKIDRGQLYGELARTAPDADESLAYLQKAQQVSVEEGKSPGLWMVAELSLRMERREMEQAQSLMQELMSKYASDQQVAQALFGVLQRFGLITPDGRMVGAPPTGAGPPPEAQGDGLWTPGAPEPPAAAPSPAAEPEDKKSGLWLPGMD